MHGYSWTIIKNFENNFTVSIEINYAKNLHHVKNSKVLAFDQNSLKENLMTAIRIQNFKQTTERNKKRKYFITNTQKIKQNLHD